MNKKIIGVIGLAVLLISLTVFVCATMISQPDGNYEVSINLREGWNIIAGTMPEWEGILASSEIQLSDIKAMWYYSPKSKEYIRVHPNPESSKLQQADEDVFLTSAMWIYSDKQGIFKYSTLEDYPSLENRQLYAGYNFVTITPDMIGKSLNDMKGECDITLAYLWDSENKQFGTILNLIDDKNILNNEAGEGHGFIVKVANDCKMGESGSSTAPPSLP